MNRGNNPILSEAVQRIGSWGSWFLILFAILYYGYYYNAGIYPAAEGGNEGVNALRLMAGQRPIVDTFLGYNVLWFYPVTWIFQITGPSYTALRIFFLILCLITGLLSFRILLRCGRSPWIALLGGILVIVVPGQMYRNYMAFLVVLNLFVLLPAYVLPERRLATRLLWMLSTGVVLGLTFLIRIDLGYFFSLIMVGLILIFPLARSATEEWGRRVFLSVLGCLLGVFGVFAVHLPFAIDADRMGFGREFAAQYEQWPNMIASQGKRLGGMIQSALSNYKATAPSDAAVVATAPTSATAPTAPASVQSAAITTQVTRASLQRVSAAALQPRDRMLAINLYFPVLLSVVMACVAMILWLMSLIKGDESQRIDSLSLLLSLGCSLTLFPQYFFWRPDMVHLGEFMVPMTLTMLLSSLFFARMIPRGLVQSALGAVMVSLSLTALVLYYINACQSQASGGIAVSQHKSKDFKASNGVHVRMTPKEFGQYSALRDIIAAVSLPGEPIICYPYNPEINFMADRPSYEHNLYADNDLPADVFSRDAIAKIQKFQPPVVVISDWDINGTEDSRFYNWAWESYRYITMNYVLACKSGNFEVYVRPDRMDRIPLEFR
jgi:hypothetical protein